MSILYIWRTGVSGSKLMVVKLSLKNGCAADLTKIDFFLVWRALLP